MSSPQEQSLLSHTPASSSLPLSRQQQPRQWHTTLFISFSFARQRLPLRFPLRLDPALRLTCRERMNPTLKQRLKLAFKPEIFLATPQPASTPATAAAVETSRLEKIADPNSMFF